MAIKANISIGGPSGPVDNSIALAYGTGVLTPDAGGGFFQVALPGFNGDSLVLACYDGAQPFVGGNSGALQVYVDTGGVVPLLTVVSSNIADNNGIRWLAIR